MTSNATRLSDVCSTAFSEPHRALKSGEVNQVVADGGRGSAKSSWASVEGVTAIVRNPAIHGVVLRKVSNTLRTSVYAQYAWAIDALGLSHKFKATVSPMELTHLPTGQKIMFFGADDPGKLKSLKVPFGYIGFLHFEELDQFAGEEEVRNLEQSILRGGDIAIEIKTFSPPKTKDNWANKYVLRDKPGQLIHHSTYLTTPREWLGQRFLDDAEHLRLTNPKAYEHEYLGIPTGSGGMVFDNVTQSAITDAEVEQFDRIYNGIDFGWYPDPAAFVRMHYAAAQRTLYIFDEFSATKTSNRDLASIVKKRIAPNELVTCDSAEPKSIADLREYGIQSRGAEKGPGSVDYSMKWLQSLNAIVIDPVRCPVAAREFMDYAYERDKRGEVVSGYPDKNDHCLSAVRYALGAVWRRRGQ